MVPLLADSTLAVALLLPIVAAFAGGVIAGATVIVPPVILFAVIGPLLGTIHRRFVSRRPAPAALAPDQGTV
jgi:hypothetical protein